MCAVFSAWAAHSELSCRVLMMIQCQQPRQDMINKVSPHEHAPVGGCTNAMAAQELCGSAYISKRSSMHMQNTAMQHTHTHERGLQLTEVTPRHLVACNFCDSQAAQAAALPRHVDSNLIQTCPIANTAQHTKMQALQLRQLKQQRLQQLLQQLGTKYDAVRISCC
jgi:hypothetical protein